MTKPGRFVFACFLATVFGASSVARADDSATARALFDEAKSLEASGKIEEACPKFLASYRMDPKPGTILNLADCYEKTGKTASAWSRFLEAAALAQRANQSEREQYAREHAKALEAKLARLTIRVSSPAPGTAVVRDGAPLDAAVLDTAVPVDPGKHVIEATAPGKRKWSTTIEVAPSQGDAKVTVPPLADAPAGSGSAPPSAAAEAPPPASNGSAMRIAGFALGGVGIVGIGVGAVFGLVASSKWSDVKSSCPNLPVCTAAARSEQHAASTDATVSTIAFIVGGAALVGGVALVIASPKPKRAPSTGLVLRPGIGSLQAEGTF